MSAIHRDAVGKIARVLLGIALCTALACEEELGLGWPPPHGGHADAGETQGRDAALPPGMRRFTATVVELFNYGSAQAGVRVGVVDADSGLPLQPPQNAVSDGQGKVTLLVPAGARFGIRVFGDATYVDSYDFQYDPEGPLGGLIRVLSATLAYAVAPIAEHAVLLDHAPLMGRVFWKSQDMQDYDVVGCALLEDDVADIRSEDLRYFDGQMPSAPSDWPLERGTNPDNGSFYAGNLLPGPHQLTARLPDGTLLGSVRLPVFARQDASSSDTQGVKANMFLASIYVDAPAGAANPTPAGCTSDAP